MAAKGLIERNSRERYGEGAGVVVPRLIQTENAPHRVAAMLNVAPNAVRKWLLAHGWHFDAGSGRWVEPVLEAEHAPEAV